MCWSKGDSGSPFNGKIMSDLNRKIDFAIKLLRSIPQDGPIELCYSGGKDSDVILELARMSGIPFEAIYKNTTIDPPGTIAHCKANGVTIMPPTMTFFQLVEKKGIPTRRARFCCEVLKEYPIRGRAIQGIRKCESTARAKRYNKGPEICWLYSGKPCVHVYLPILEWTNDDVTQFIKDRVIKCHPLYYDENGSFHVERRLGCIGCPLKSDCGKSDYIRYPGMLKRLIISGEKYLDTHPNCNARKKFGTSYNLVFHNLFTKSYEGYQGYTNGLLPDANVDTKEFLESYFNIDLTI